MGTDNHSSRNHDARNRERFSRMHNQLLHAILLAIARTFTTSTAFPCLSEHLLIALAEIRIHELESIVTKSWFRLSAVVETAMLSRVLAQPSVIMHARTGLELGAWHDRAHISVEKYFLENTQALFNCSVSEGATRGFYDWWFREIERGFFELEGRVMKIKELCHTTYTCWSMGTPLKTTPIIMNYIVWWSCSTNRPSPINICASFPTRTRSGTMGIALLPIFNVLYQSNHLQTVVPS